MTAHLRLGTCRALLGLAVLAAAGCTPEPPADTGPPALPLAGVTLRLVVAGDPAVAAAIRQLRDEWNAQTGSKLEVQEMTPEELAASEALPGDAVIGPSHLLGPFAERKCLAPVPGNLCPQDHGPWSEIFDALRLHEATWGGRTMAVPFGSPVLCCYYRADLLEKLNRQPPQTWAEYVDLAKRFRELGQAGGARYGTIEPLGPGWAGLVLLAHAAAYAQHRDNYSVLFDIETMEPLVAGPPFVRALEELVEASKSGPAEQLGYDPAAARSAFWNGESAMALSWPTAARGIALPRTAASLPVGFAELPGSKQVYNVGTRAWEDRAEGSETRVPFVGTSGRLGMVSARGDCPDFRRPLRGGRAGENGTVPLRRPGAAFQLLLWLSDAQMSPRVCPVSPATTLFRRSHVHAPQDWVEKPVPASAAVQYAELTRQTLIRQPSLTAPRIPGRGEYLAVLDEAVRAAVAGKRPPAEALGEAASRWRQITERLGVQQQKAAYLHSLGLE